MKKFLNVKSVSAIILCFILAFILCACQNSEPSSSSDDTTSTLSSPSLYIDDETSSDTTVDNSSQDEVSSETTTDTPPKDTEPPVTSSDTSTSSSNTPSDTTDKTPTPSQPTTTESTPTTSTPITPVIKTASDLIVGKWRGSYDMAPALSEIGLGTIEGTAIVSCDVEFTSTGIFYETIDRASAKSAYHNVFTQLLNNTLSEEGYTKEQFEAENGITFDEYVGIMVDAAIESIPQTIINAYKFEGNDLYVRTQDDIDFVKNEYRFDGENTLTLTEDGESITYTRIG